MYISRKGITVFISVFVVGCFALRGIVFLHRRRIFSREKYQ